MTDSSTDKAAAESTAPENAPAMNTESASAKRPTRHAQASKILSAGAAASLTLGIVASIAHSTSAEARRNAEREQAEYNAQLQQEQLIADAQFAAMEVGRNQALIAAQAQIDAVYQAAQAQIDRANAATAAANAAAQSASAEASAAAAVPGPPVLAPGPIVLNVPAPKPAPVVPQRQRSTASSGTTSQSS